MRKSALAIVCVFLIFMLSFISNIPEAGANDFMLQVSDPKDAYRDMEIDIKSVYARTDKDNIYFRLDSWGNWDLEKNNCFIAIYFSSRAGNSIRDTDYLIIIIQVDGSYSAAIADSRGNLINVYSPYFFQKENSTGILQISKQDVYDKDDKFSFQVTVLSLTYDSNIDEAPEGDMLAIYKAGPTSNNAKLSVEPRFLDFGTVEHNASPTRKFNIINDGRGELKASIKSSSSSLSFYPDEVYLSEYGITEVSVILQKSDRKEGYSEETFTIDSNGGTSTVTVKMDILPTPVLSCETTMIDFGVNFLGDRPSESFFVRNKVRGNIKGTISANQRWMTLSKTNFDCTQDEINLGVNTRSMSPGTHTGRVSINSNGGTHSFNVTIEVKSALSIDQEKIDFGEFDLDDTETFPILYLEIENVSSESQQVSIEITDSWLDVSNSSFNLGKRQRDKLALSIQRKHLDSNSKKYSTYITIKTKNESYQIPVSLSIKATPPKAEWMKKEGQTRDIRISIFQGEKIEEFIQIKNSGGGILEGSAELKNKNTPHRLFSPKFSLKKGETHDFKISFDSTNQELKDYREVLVITTNTGKLEIPVIISVIPLPEIVIKLFIGISYAYIDDKEIILDAPPYISKGSSMVPLRFISEAFNAEVKWENIGKGRIYITLKNNKIRLDIGEQLAFINDVPCVLSVPPEIKSSRTFVPIRFISEGFGAKVEWDGSKNQISIRYNP